MAAVRWASTRDSSTREAGRDQDIRSSLPSPRARIPYRRVVIRKACMAVTLVALLVAAFLSFPPTEASAYSSEGTVLVELSGVSSISTHGERQIKGTDAHTKQPYKFRQERWGRDFYYLLSGLRKASYDVELSFFEPVYGPEERIFTVYANGSPLPGLTDLDIASRVGRDTAYQVTARNVAAPGGKMELRFAASRREATVCNIRLVSGGSTALEINVLADRHWQSPPIRFTGGAGQAVHEVILGRFGSRFMINPQPQFLAWRQSPLGTWADDPSELVLAFRDAEGDIRCLPFTPRYPVFSGITQENSLTGVEYECSDPALPFRVRISLKAPFYPRDIRLSTAPFFYLDVEVTNTSSRAVEGSFLLALAHRDDNTGDNSPQPLASAPGYRFRTRYTFGTESYVRPGNNSGFVAFDEALTLSDDTGVTWRYRDPRDTGWIWPSPEGHPLPYPHLVYTFVPRGYSGLEWEFQLPPGGGQSKHGVLAAHTSSPVLNVRGDTSYRFLYQKPDGPNLASVEEVVAYALSERDAITQKSDFFDRLLSEEYLSPFPQAGRGLLALAFQNFVINAWWCYGSGGQEWFSVWEGIPCMFHSTIDVEYNNAWFYLLFWPELLGKLLREWTLFEKSNPQGKYLSHDMGVVNRVTGMAYPHDMPVEENANYLLLLYAYWRHTGDQATLAELYPKAADYLGFILRCDADGNGLPDLHTSNTIDQGSDAIQHARNQVYLGVKTLASCRAFVEISEALGKSGSLVNSARETIIRINQALDTLWLGDHFAVCEDPDISPEEAEAYSLYASNGLLYLLASGLDTGLTAENLERMKKDIVSGASRLTRRYGDVHTSVNNENQWVSQNLWRDALGYYLGLPDWPQGQDSRTNRYWNLQLLYATRQRGGFWDVCDYRDHFFMGTSEVHARGFPSQESLRAYLRSISEAEEEFTGASSLLEPYQQSLGYYPRGASAFVLIPALARLRLDRPSDLLLYEPSRAPSRVPVLSCAEWEATDPAARIPLLVFNDQGELTRVENRALLPAQVRRPGYRPVTGLEARPFSCLPGSEPGVRVSYQAPSGVIRKAYILSGGTIIRRVNPGADGFTWDGRDEGGSPVTDGTYTVYLEASQADKETMTPSSTLKAGVNTDIPTPSTTWYLAEGYTGSNPTGGDFETWLLLQNPSDQAAEVRVTFMQPGGANTVRVYTLAPRSRFTVSVDQVLPASEVSTLVEASVPVVAERAMYWSGRRAGHASIGVDSPSTTWYLAEGYTGGNFDEWILVQNPGGQEATVNVQFQTPGGGALDRSYKVGPCSRFTIHVDDLLRDHELSALVTSDVPVVVERAQYLNDMQSGTCSLGARSPSRTWYFAEGYTDQGFEEWLLVQNPQDRPARLRLTFMAGNGAVTLRSYQVPARSRFTLPVHQLLPGRELSIRLESDIPVVAERAMYWGGRTDGHASLGTPAPEYAWCLAEGYTDQGFETWILLQNPNPLPARVTVTFMLPSGRTLQREYAVVPFSRFTLNAAEVVGRSEFSTRVTSSQPLVAERAMYWNGRSGGHCSVGVIER